MTLTEIAEEISAHLSRFEADPEINPSVSYDRELDKWVKDANGTRSYFNAHAWRGGSRVMIRYVGYQNTRSLTKAQALQYLEWLDAGNVGKHHAVPDAS